MNRFGILFIAFVLFGSCKEANSPVTDVPAHSLTKYARLFSIEDYKDFKLLHIHKGYPGSPSFTYVLSRSSANIPDSLKNLPFIQVPVKKWIVTSTTHLPPISMLHAENTLTAFPGTRDVSSPVFRKKIEENQIKEIGINGRLNTEEVLAMQPDLLMLFRSGNDIQNDKLFQKNGIPVLYNADWLETDPLGRAEWIKVFGALLDKQAMADSLFRQIEKNYERVKEKIPRNQQPPVVFQGGKFGDKFFVPGGNSYAVRLIKDAGGTYLWKEDNHTGSLQLNYENVLLKLPEADIWLNPGMYNNKQELLKDLPVVGKLPVYQRDKIYTYNLKKGATGGVLYFEYSNMHPDWVLDDLLHIFYPQDEEYRFHFYDKLP